MFRRMLVVLLLAGTSLVAMAEAPKTHKPSQKWALLIGINDYAYLNKLRFCGADMQALRNQLIDAGFVNDQVRLLTDTASDKKYLPVKVNIETQIELLAKLAEEGDVLLVAFAGHGIERHGQGYLCPQDARIDVTGNTLIPVDWVYKRLEKSKAALRLMVVDACREEVDPESTRSAIDLVEDAKQFAKELESIPKGTVLLNSCAPGEYAREDRSLSHGVFSHFLLKGLQGEADENGDGIITVGELAKYTTRETKKYVALKFAYSQIPYVKQDAEIGALDYDIGRVNNKSTQAASVQPKPIEATPAKPIDPEAQPKSPADPMLLKAPFDEKTAQAGIDSWAKRIGQKPTYVNTLGMKFQLIPPGEFEMGSDEDPDALLKLAKSLGGYADEPTRDWYSREHPKHRVRITQPYFLGIYELRKKDFKAFIDDQNYKTDAERDAKGGWGWDSTKDNFAESPKYTWYDWGVNQSDNSPVINVSWNDAQAFCRWLSRKEERTYRLPTEAQWEYACRAGTTTRYYNGNDSQEITRVGNVTDAITAEKFHWGKEVRTSDGYAFSAPVGQFKPNAFGLFDMHGNAAEWCQDWYAVDYYSKRIVDDPQGPDSGTRRVFRGGGWNDYALDCRSASRSHHDPSTRYNSIGFRVLLVPSSSGR